MFEALTAKLGVYAIVGVIAAALVGGGYLYIRTLRAENTALQGQIGTYKATIASRDTQIKTLQDNQAQQIAALNGLNQKVQDSEEQKPAFDKASRQ